MSRKFLGSAYKHARIQYIRQREGSCLCVGLLSGQSKVLVTFPPLSLATNVEDVTRLTDTSV